MDLKLQCKPNRCPSRNTGNPYGLNVYRENQNKTGAYATSHIGKQKTLFVTEDLT